jgi:ornithine cyclodeaminase
MKLIPAETVHQVLVYSDLVERLRQAFAAADDTPVRHHHTIARNNQPDATLLLMPAWRPGGQVAVKILSVFPGNAAKGLASINAQVLVLDGETGQALALIEGASLTVRRTACASALAADYLARPEASHLLMVGAGALAPHLIAAHAAVRPIRSVAVWNRSPERAETLVRALADQGLAARLAGDLESEVPKADIISCATMSSEALIHGDWLAPGCHLDLVGAFRPDMRESDDAAVNIARIYVDTRGGALKEGGDIVQPLAAGVITEQDIIADFSELTRGLKPGRRSADEITLFKSVGSAVEDLAAAELVVERA